MKNSIDHSAWNEVAADALLIPLFQDDDWGSGVARQLDEALDGLLTLLRKSHEWRGRRGEYLHLLRQPGVAAGRLLLVGCGRRPDAHPARIGNQLHQALATIKGRGPRSVAVLHRSGLPLAALAQAAAEAATLSTCSAAAYKTANVARGRVEQTLIVADAGAADPAAEEWMERGRIVARATNLTRRLVNQPGNEIGPGALAGEARRVAEDSGLEIEVLDERELEARGMNGVLAVSQGSDESAQFVILSHRNAPEPDSPPVVLIGKGVTFDTGGISIKPAQSMEEMKADKAGACAVLGAMLALARLEVPLNVSALMPCVENMPSGRAQRPGDVIRSLSGRTIEVINTDAEGRLILADALTYACRELQARWIVDIATLTGACVVALGHVRAGLFSNDDALCARLEGAATRAGEGLWRLPLDDEYRGELDSDIADLKNVGPRWGGAVTAAKFLEAFVESTPWCHIDMAGVDTFTDDQEVAGPTGFGVRTLVELVLEEAAE